MTATTVWVLAEHDYDENSSSVVGVFTDLDEALVLLHDLYEGYVQEDVTHEQFFEQITAEAEYASVVLDLGETSDDGMCWQIRPFQLPTPEVTT